jgi:hypothetical protein
MLYGAQVAVCFEINTKQINRAWTEIYFLNFKPADARSQ